MKRFISGLTSLAMMASIAVSSIASVSAANDDYIFSFETAFGENTTTITTEEVAAGDVTVPIELRSYNDPGTCSIVITMELDEAAEKAGLTMTGQEGGIKTGIFPDRGAFMYYAPNNKFAWLSSETAEDQVALVGPEYYILRFDVVVPQGTPEGSYSVSAMQTGNYEDFQVLSTSDDENGKPIYTELFPTVKGATIILSGGTTTEPTDTTTLKATSIRQNS